MRCGPTGAGPDRRHLARRRATRRHPGHRRRVGLGQAGVRQRRAGAEHRTVGRCHKPFPRAHQATTRGLSRQGVLPLRPGPGRPLPRLPDGQAEAVHLRGGRPHPERFGLRPGAISFCGLKDKQGRTEQLIAVDGADVDLQEPDLRLKPWGAPTGRCRRRTSPPTASRSRSARSTEEDLDAAATRAAAEVNRLGVVNYFDSQRFGSLKHGQGFIAKDLLRGDFEAALQNYLAKPSPLDRSDDAKVKDFWREHWGDWTRRVPFEAAQEATTGSSARSGRSPRTTSGPSCRSTPPTGRCCSSPTRATSGTRACGGCSSSCSRATHLFPLRYQAGTLLFHQDARPRALRWLRGLTFPLLGPDSPLRRADASARRWSGCWARRSSGSSELRIPGRRAAPLLQARGARRPRVPGQARARAHPAGRAQPRVAKLNVAFTLPPGSYATLVVKRLFHRTARRTRPRRSRPAPGAAGQTCARRKRGLRTTGVCRDLLTARRSTPPRRGASRPEPGRTRAPAPRSDRPQSPEPGKTKSLRPGPGFRALAKARKEAKADARARQKLR